MLSPELPRNSRNSPGNSRNSREYIITHLWKNAADKTMLAKGTIIANKAEVVTEKDEFTTRTRS
jgi:hypothetical protein